MIKKGSLVRLRLDGRSDYLNNNTNDFKIGDYAIITHIGKLKWHSLGMAYHNICKPFNKSITDVVFRGHCVNVLSAKCMGKLREIIKTTLKKKKLEDYKPIKLMDISEEETGERLSILFKNKDKYVQLNISNVKKIREIDVNV